MLKRRDVDEPHAYYRERETKRSVTAKISFFSRRRALRKHLGMGDGITIREERFVGAEHMLTAAVCTGVANHSKYI